MTDITEEAEAESEVGAGAEKGGGTATEETTGETGETEAEIEIGTAGLRGDSLHVFIALLYSIVTRL